MQVIEIRDSEIKDCKFCNGKIAWLRNKMGKWYPVNVDYAMNHAAATFKTNFHRCQGRA
jgi:hypothetical protein